MDVPRIRVGINGFGRLGRLLFRAILNSSQFIVGGINDPAMDASYMAYLIQYDSEYGQLQNAIIDVDNESEQGFLIINERKIPVFSFVDASEIPWGREEVEYVAETTGRLLSTSSANVHLLSGARKVVIAGCPTDLYTPIFVMGVNQEFYNPRSMHVVSNGCSSTYCLAPLLKILYEQFGLQDALVTTIHSGMYIAAQIVSPTN